MDWNPLATTRAAENSCMIGAGFPERHPPACRQNRHRGAAAAGDPGDLLLQSHGAAGERERDLSGRNGDRVGIPSRTPMPRGGILKAGEPAARWEKLMVLAPNASAPALLKEAAGSHYYAARATESNLVQIPSAGGKTETEKFLFYRGIGSFVAPLTVKQGTRTNSELALRNTGSERLAGMVVYEVRGNEARFSWVPTLAPDEERSFSSSRKTCRSNRCRKSVPAWLPTCGES